MFEAKLTEGHVLKKIIEAIKDIVNDVNLDVSASGKCPIIFLFVVKILVELRELLKWLSLPHFG